MDCMDRFKDKAVEVAALFNLQVFQARLVVAQASGALTWADLWRMLLDDPNISLPTDINIIKIYEKHITPRGMGNSTLFNNKYNSVVKVKSINKTKTSFLPFDDEKDLILKVQKYIRSNHCLIRLTFTMIDKSIIDASKFICKILHDNEIFDYESAEDGDIKYIDIIVLTENGYKMVRTSFYRPKAKKKKGDPRFWPQNFNRLVKEGTLIYLTTFNNKFLIIPLVKDVCNYAHLEGLFGPINSDVDLVQELISKIKVFSNKWQISCSPSRSSPKDVGDTFEMLLGLSINNHSSADYKSAIELKAKRSLSKTADTLFSQVPDWSLSPIKSVRDMMFKYGYNSTHPRRKGYKDLFVTVSNKPNPQGLYLEVDYESEQVVQYFVSGSKKEITTIWMFDKLEQRLNDKHPKTAWIIAEEKLIDDKYYFNYNKMELTQKPIFSQFLSLIEQSIISYDWRGGHEIDGKGRVDKGHAFRLKSPKFRCQLFGESEDISICSV